MNFSTLYRVSFYLMLVFAALVSSVDVVDNRFALLFPVLVAGGSFLAFFTVDRDSARAISSLFADMLAIVVSGLALAEYVSDTTQLVPALAHWLVYFTIIYLFRPKSPAGDWVMFRLGLFQVLLGTVISQSDLVGFLLLAWALLTLWVLILFSLQREALRAEAMMRGPDAPPTPSAPAVGPDAPAFYPGLLTGAFLLAALRVTLVTLALGGGIFLAMPRRASMARPQGQERGGQHLTGFDEEVQLGQLGEILENDSVVMTIQLFDEANKPIELPGESLWRGVTMATYDNGRWRRQRQRQRTFPIIFPDSIRNRPASRPRGAIRQQIKLESTDSSALFGLWPMLEATARGRFSPDLSSVDGTIYRAFPRPGAYDYEVLSFRDPEVPQPGETAPSGLLMVELSRVPEPIHEELRALAETVVARAVPPESRDDRGAVARALESYLRDSGTFSYTLHQNVVDASIDPVLDFLRNRKEGHCEYFASALTLLLRAMDIPARMVNGFKGGDYNGIARLYNVRQKHAHSWVEAYLGATPDNDRSPLWLTLDPTPGLERDASIAAVGGYKENFRQISDYIRYLWVFYIVGYNADRQNAILYGPARILAREAQNGFRIMGQWLRKESAQVRKWVRFEERVDLFSVRGFVVAFAGCLLIVATARAAIWLAARLIHWYRGPIEDATALTRGAAHYRRLARLLAGFGLERPPAETPEEFARRATLYLTGNGSLTEAVAEVPRDVVDAFYRVRFGHLDLPPADIARIEARLDALEATLNAPNA